MSGEFERKTAVQNTNEINQLLQYVANGEQDKAEELIKKRPELLLLKGNVTDPSERSFEGITAFQYAMWALDRHMWAMLLDNWPKMSTEEQVKQWSDWNERPIHPHGKHVNWQGLIDAYALYNKSKKREILNRTIGQAQLKLPVHVANEYCRTDRAFSPLPDFRSTKKLPRNRTTHWGGDWYDKRCGQGWAHFRGSRLEGVELTQCREFRFVRLDSDREAITELLKVRKEEIEELGKHLLAAV